LYTYKTTFGNSYRSFSRIQGRDGTIANHGGEGASFFAVSKEGGRDESDGSVDYTKLPIIAPAGDQEKVVQVPGAPPPSSTGPNDDDAHHLMNWLTAMQARKPPGATVDNGFSHAIVVIMAAQSYRTGKKLYWDPKNERILDHSIV
jgi:hypothetical protein